MVGFSFPWSGRGGDRCRFLGEFPSPLTGCTAAFGLLGRVGSANGVELFSLALGLVCGRPDQGYLGNFALGRGRSSFSLAPCLA